MIATISQDCEDSPVVVPGQLAASTQRRGPVGALYRSRRGNDRPADSQDHGRDDEEQGADRDTDAGNDLRSRHHRQDRQPATDHISNLRTLSACEAEQHLHLKRRDERIDQRQPHQQEHELGADAETALALREQHDHDLKGHHNNPRQEDEQQRQPRVQLQRRFEDLSDRARAVEVDPSGDSFHPDRAGGGARAVEFDRSTGVPCRGSRLSSGRIRAGRARRRSRRARTPGRAQRRKRPPRRARRSPPRCP